MSASGRTLTQDEFEQLLQRAVERHGRREPRAFSIGELVEAGQELGIDADTVRDVYQEHERALALPPTRPRPLGSTLTLDKSGDTLTLRIPPQTAAQVKAGLKTALTAGLMAFLPGAGAPWPLTAAGAALTAAVGYFSIRSARAVRELRLKRDGSGLLCRFVGGRGKGLPLQAGQVQARLDERPVPTNAGTRRITFVALDHGTETFELLEGFSHAEQSWVLEEIQRWLGRR